MTRYEYKVVPAPRRGIKAKGVKAPEGRFALALQEVMNDHATKGWEFQRAETLPSDERQGLTSSQTVYRDMLVFRRPLDLEGAARAEPQETVNPAPVLSHEPEEPHHPDAPTEAETHDAYDDEGNNPYGDGDDAPHAPKPDPEEIEQPAPERS